jgi:hypothetical protein
VRSVAGSNGQSTAVNIVIVRQNSQMKQLVKHGKHVTADICCFEADSPERWFEGQ